MDKTLTTILLIIASLVCTIMVINAVYPATSLSTGAITSASTQMGERMKSQVEVIHAAGELDSGGAWQDINGNGKFDIFIWVKNIGTTRIVSLENCDVFIGEGGAWTRVPQEEWAEGASPSWSYTIENGEEWRQATTLKIDVSYAVPLPGGEYTLKFITPNGIAEEYSFSI